MVQFQYWLKGQQNEAKTYKNVTVLFYCCSAENLTEQDIETKFSSLSLAFKTDRVTLQVLAEI